MLRKTFGEVGAKGVWLIHLEGDARTEIGTVLVGVGREKCKEKQSTLQGELICE